MEKSVTLKVLSRIGLIVFIYILLYKFFIGFSAIPSEGDSVDYHIPIAQNIANGNYFNFEYYKMPQYYYPAVSEAILSVFIAFGIPLGIYNIVALIILFFVLIKLGQVFGLSKSFSLIFALSICTLGAITRWLDTQIIDIWVAVFFASTLILLQSNKRTIKDYFLIGLFLGALVGSKYTGFLYGGVLTVVYFKSLIANLSYQKFLAALLPFLLVGIPWYIRNFIVMQNPFYPVDNPLFKGDIVFKERVWNIMLSYPVEKFNAFFSEYKLWVLSIFALPFFLKIRSKVSTKEAKKVIILSTIGLLNFLLYLAFVSSYQEWIMVSVMRYAFPVFIPLILSVFVIAQVKKWEIWLSYLSFMGMIIFNSFTYYPKLDLLLVPISFVAFYILDRKGFK